MYAKNRDGLMELEHHHQANITVDILKAENTLRSEVAGESMVTNKIFL